MTRRVYFYILESFSKLSPYFSDLSTFALYENAQIIYRKMVDRKYRTELRDMLNRKQKKYVREQAVDVKLQELAQKDLLPRYGSSEVDKQRKVILLQLIQELYIADPRAFVGIKADLVRTYLGFLDLLLQTDRKVEILPIVEQAIPLSDKERERIRKILEK